MNQAVFSGSLKHIFDSAGNRASLTSTKEQQYIGYLQYTNTKMLFAVDQIVALSATPPAIMLMSDHGIETMGTPQNY